ncbi:hypothetical protein ACWIGI_36280 [Nocardia sp. NPDC055321]
MSVLLAAVAALTLTACSGLLTDYDAVAAELKAQISAMPGVQRFDITIGDDFFEGDSYLRITAGVPDATDQQLDDVVERLREHIGEFDGLRERDIEFVVGDRARVAINRELDLDSFRETVRHVRQYTASVPDVRIYWDERTTPRINIMDVKTGTAEPLVAIRAMIGPDSAAEVKIEAPEFEHWNVKLPLPVDREIDLRRQLSEIPWAIKFIEIDGSQVVSLMLHEKTPSTPDADIAFDALSSAVRAVSPTPEHPLRLTWNWFFYYTESKRNEGYLHAAGCDYYLSTITEERLSAVALTVQRRMREEFDTCE